MVDGRPVPADYFLFASATLSADTIRKAKAKHGRVLVGFDSGAIPQTGEIYEPSFKVARDLGAELEIYVEGPGGATGNTGWLPDERARVEVAAKEVGIDIAINSWREKFWDTGGWKAYTFLQLERYRKQGFDAAEIDNLDRVVKGTDALMAFYKEYATRQATGAIPQLVMKNVQLEDVHRIVRAVQANELPRAMFSEFHIFECGKTDEWAPVDKVTKTIGIRTVPSRNTYKYDAKGTFGLQKEFDTAYGLDKPAPASADTPVA
jgi:hypothetical protein